MGDPRLDPFLVRHLQPGPDHVAQRIEPRVIVDQLLEIPIATGVRPHCVGEKECTYRAS